MYEETLREVMRFLKQWKIKNVTSGDAEFMIQLWVRKYGDSKESLNNFYKGYTKSIGLGNPWKSEGDFSPRTREKGVIDMKDLFIQ